jgi:tRNA(Ser,Leu) C12 N-acetylase TAN1
MKPEDLANAMTLRKLHYEIEKAEADLEEIEEKIKIVKETPKTKKPKSFWAFLTMDSDEE